MTQLSPLLVTDTLTCVIRFVLSVENDLAFRARIPEIAVKDFSYGSYATIFNAEVNSFVVLGFLIPWSRLL